MLVSELKGVGKKRAEQFAAAGIITTSDLLSFYPVSFENWTDIRKICDLQPGIKCTLKVSLLNARNHFLRGQRKMMMRLKVSDESGVIEIIYFNSKFYQQQAFIPGHSYAFYGSISEGKDGMMQMINPNFQDISVNAELNIRPVYHTIKGISQSMLRGLIDQALSEGIVVEETLPEALQSEHKLCSRDFALKNIHFPENRKAYAAAKYRFIYEELLFFQLGLFLKGNTRCNRGGISYPADKSIDDFLDKLSFQLTDAQQRVLAEINRDMEAEISMQRLVQGDVGSGKTVIAAAALYKAAKNGWQGVLMAPTELLAMQHFESFSKLFEDSGINIGFLSSHLSASEKSSVLSGLKNHEIDILIGTNSVIQPDVEYDKLGLVVTDEQHRFGVGQRIALSEKGESPDVLVMTATPIPRTLAMVLYGDFDISVIDELPPGRKPVKTEVKPLSSRAAVYRSVKKQLELGRQAYAVAPLVSDSEVVDAMSSETLREDLIKRFPAYNIGLVNGSMKQEEKDRVMSEFAAGHIHILVATVVIEVGINVPNATIMVIENAERFGLAQLHQLRGRVGRGGEQSYCMLLVDKNQELGYKRAEVIASTTDGFEISDKDLEMRGPGDFFGTRQHGTANLQLADLSRHAGILNELRGKVKEILQEDPVLAKPENRLLAEGVNRIFGNTDRLTV
ncbi:MAG: ATP-dependent DNA helicase RecG [Anaerovoracaceae bacterium]